MNKRTRLILDLSRKQQDICDQRPNYLNEELIANTSTQSLFFENQNSCQSSYILTNLDAQPSFSNQIVVQEKRLNNLNMQMSDSNKSLIIETELNNSHLTPNCESTTIQPLLIVGENACDTGTTIPYQLSGEILLENHDLFTPSTNTLTGGYCPIELEKSQNQATSFSEDLIEEKENLEEDFSDDDSVQDPDFSCDNAETDESDEDITAPAAKRRKEKRNCTEKESEGTGAQDRDSSTSKSKRRSRKEREMAKVLRNTGKEYVSEKGKTVIARVMKPLTECRMKCQNRFPDDIRLILFEEYWKLGKHDKRANFLSSLIYIVEKKTIRQRTESDRLRKFSCKYDLTVKGERKPICKKCFIATFSETNAFVNQLILNRQISMSSIIEDDQRGRSAPKNKWPQEVLNDVVNHIHSFPAYESHYCRQTTSKKYLQSDLTISKMYALYKENRERCVSMTIYAKKFHELGLAFKKPHKDTCYKCDTLKIKIAYANEEEKQNLILEQTIHHSAADDAYKAKAIDKSIAREDPTTAVFAFDLQQCLPTPYLKTSISFYKRQLWTYNLTVHNLATNEAVCYVWNESVSARGRNQIASCLYRHIMELPLNIKKVCFYSDTCGGQNKNSHVAAMFMTVLRKKTSLQSIDHKFLVSGHTHMECDVDHATIEKAKKKTSMKINHPYDWVQLIRGCKKTNPFTVTVMECDHFLNFSDLLKGQFVQKKVTENGEKFLWKDLQWARYCAENIGVLNYKSSLNCEDNFKTVNFRRRGKQTTLVTLTQINEGPVPINKEKKKNLMEVLHLVDKEFRPFYQNLKVADVPDMDPDLVEIDPDDH